MWQTSSSAQLSTCLLLIMCCLVVLDVGFSGHSCRLKHAVPTEAVQPLACFRGVAMPVVVPVAKRLHLCSDMLLQPSGMLCADSSLNVESAS